MLSFQKFLLKEFRHGKFVAQIMAFDVPGCSYTVSRHKKHKRHFFRRYFSKKGWKKYLNSQFWNRREIRVLSQNAIGKNGLRFKSNVRNSVIRQVNHPKLDLICGTLLLEKCMQFVGIWNILIFICGAAANLRTLDINRIFYWGPTPL